MQCKKSMAGSQLHNSARARKNWRKKCGRNERGKNGKNWEPRSPIKSSGHLLPIRRYTAAAYMCMSSVHFFGAIHARHMSTPCKFSVKRTHMYCSVYATVLQVLEKNMSSYFFSLSPQIDSRERAQMIMMMSFPSSCRTARSKQQQQPPSRDNENLIYYSFIFSARVVSLSTGKLNSLWTAFRKNW